MHYKVGITTSKTNSLFHSFHLHLMIRTTIPLTVLIIEDVLLFHSATLNSIGELTGVLFFLFKVDIDTRMFDMSFIFFYTAV